MSLSALPPNFFALMEISSDQVVDYLDLVSKRKMVLSNGQLVPAQFIVSQPQLTSVMFPADKFDETGTVLFALTVFHNWDGKIDDQVLSLNTIKP